MHIGSATDLEATAGNGVLSNPLGMDLGELDEDWRQTLFDESGAVLGGSSGWVLGLALAIGLLMLGVLMGWWGRRQKRMIEAKMRDLEWLEEMSHEARQRETVRTSIAGRAGRRDARVGRRGPDSGGVDGDDRDGSPAGGEYRTGRNGMSGRSEPGDDRFRHPGFDQDD